MSDPVEPTVEPTAEPPITKQDQPSSSRYLFGLWLLMAGLWKTGEVAWTVLRGLARLIA